MHIVRIAGQVNEEANALPGTEQRLDKQQLLLSLHLIGLEKPGRGADPAVGGAG